MCQQRSALIPSSYLFTHHPSFCPCVIRNINSTAKAKDKGNSVLMSNAKTCKKSKLRSTLILTPELESDSRLGHFNHWGKSAGTHYMGGSIVIVYVLISIRLLVVYRSVEIIVKFDKICECICCVEVTFFFWEHSGVNFDTRFASPKCRADEWRRTEGETEENN
jgi:hypothetical protein